MQGPTSTLKLPLASSQTARQRLSIRRSLVPSLGLASPLCSTIGLRSQEQNRDEDERVDKRIDECMERMTDGLKELVDFHLELFEHIGHSVH